VGFFDPAYKKMLAKAPASFRERADMWLVMIEEGIKRHNAVVSADFYRATMIGHLAITSSEKEPGIWSEDALKDIKLKLNASNTMLSKELQLAAFRDAEMIYSLAG
jgi:hypothetical protein